VKPSSLLGSRELVSIGSPADSAAIDIDPALDEVERWIRNKATHLATLFAKAIRQALDEVIDGGRTGRWAIVQLEKTEKTYIGTKIEILVRTALELPREKPLDTVIAGHPVDIKWSSVRSSWQIPTEAVDQLCLLVAGDESRGTFEVGLLRCAGPLLNAGMNKDGKRTISKDGRARIRWLVAGGTLPPNFLATLDPAVREAIMAEPPGQRRVRKLFTLVQKTPVPRLTIETLAQQRDPMRRIRKDKRDRLGGLRILGGHYAKTNAIVQALGYPPLAKDEYMSVPRNEITQLGLNGDEL
jgi:Restriction endonuclease NaeI